MSIILKALKKAEESKVEKEPAKQVHAYQGSNKKILGMFFAGFIGLVVIFFIGINWFKGRPVSTPSSKASDKITDVQTVNVQKTVEKKMPVVTENIGITKLHEDAIKNIKEKNYAGAESMLRKALFSKPDDAVMQNHMGIVLKNQSRYKEASRAYQRALQLKPDYFEAMNNLAVTYEMLGDREKAKSLYKKALSIKPSYAEAHLNYALLLEAEGNNSEAENHYYTFLNLSSDEFLKSKVKERLRALGK